MGYIYENGLTVVGKNKNKAIEWYRKSADNGNKYATEKLRKLQA
jgi:TPR repeat protein